VNTTARTILAGSLALLGALNLHALDLDAWHIGETASQDIRTPAALDVIDTDATAMRKAEAALKTPAIFLNHSSVTNTMVEKVTAAFAGSHADFLAGLQETFQQTYLTETAVQSPEFEHFVTTFNVKNKKLSISAGLARQWTRGETGLDVETNLIRQLLLTTSRPVRPDTLPDGFMLGETVRLVPVHSSRDEFTLDQAEQIGTVVNLSTVTTVTRLRGLFRRDFPPQDQLFAKTLATYIHPNLELETNLTQAARERAVSQIVVAYHYTAGQFIARRGQVIDAKMLTALARLNETLPVEPPSQPMTAAHDQAQPEPAIALPVQAPNLRANYVWLGAAFAVVSAVVLLAFWRLLAARRRAALVPARPAELAPQLAQMLKSAVVQELAAQRHELLETQQHAAAEVVRLMHRLNELHAPLQERLAAYERRIQELEQELGEQSKENRELLKLKIDLLREQLESERNRNRLNFN